MANAYAGLAKGELNLLVAKTTADFAEMLKQIAVPMSGDRILTDAGDARGCDTCHDHLTVENLGTVMPGSTLMFCDDPLCLATYFAEHLPDEDAR